MTKRDIVEAVYFALELHKLQYKGEGLTDDNVGYILEEAEGAGMWFQDAMDGRNKE